MKTEHVQISPSQHGVLMRGLLLFGFSIALSKSATNIAIGFVYLFVLVLVVRNQSFRSALFRNAYQPLLIPIVVYFSVVVLGLLFTDDFAAGIGIFNKTSGLLLVYWMASALLDSIEDTKAMYRQAERLLLFFVVGIFSLDAVGLMTYSGLIGNEKYSLPLAPLNVHHIWFSNLNSLGMYVAAGFLLFSLERQNPVKKVFLSLSLLVGGVSILLSQSRTAWLGMFATVLILSYLCITKRKVFLATLAGMVTAVILLYLSSSIFQDRMNLIASDLLKFSMGEAKTNVGERILMWKASLMMFASNPVVGVGTGDYSIMMRHYVGQGLFPEFLLQYNQPHNTYLFALATNGLFGLLTLVYIYYKGLVFSLPGLRSTGSRKLLAFVGVAAIVHFMVAGLTDSFFKIQILRYGFAFIMGMCVRNSLKADPGS